MFLFTTTRNGVAAKRVERELSVTYKTTWRMSHEIRKYMAARDSDDPLGGPGEVLEIDETMIGGKSPSTDGGRYAPNKACVVGMLEKDGELITRAVPNVKEHTLIPVVQACAARYARPHRRAPQLSARTFTLAANTCPSTLASLSTAGTCGTPRSSCLIGCCTASRARISGAELTNASHARFGIHVPKLDCYLQLVATVTLRSTLVGYILYPTHVGALSFTEGTELVLKFAEKLTVRAPLAARPQPNMDRKSLREAISAHFSKSLEYLAK
jgi:hypothetical protein